MATERDQILSFAGLVGLDFGELDLRRCYRALVPALSRLLEGRPG